MSFVMIFNYYSSAILSSIHVFGIHEGLCLINRFKSLKYLQHSDTHDSTQKKNRKQKKKKNIQFTTFQNVCNITKHLKLTVTLVPTNI